MAWAKTGNIAGPAGTAGPTGPTGPTGATGPTGPAGADASTPGAWQNMTLTGSTTDTGYATPAVRKEGDVGRMRGRLSLTVAYTSGNTLMTLPSGMEPSFKQAISVRSTVGATDLIFNTNGIVQGGSGYANAAKVDLDGIAYLL